jgi:hypothetical protein
MSTMTKDMRRERRVPTMMNDTEYRQLVTVASECSVAWGRNVSLGEIVRRAVGCYDAPETDPKDMNTHHGG